MGGMADRTFGVELEIIGLSEEGVYLALRKHGIPVEDPNRCSDRYNNGNQADVWSIHDDSSIESDDGRTAEVVSPILRGIEGLRQVRKVCRALADFGASVNESCGLHVHVGADDLTPEEVETIVRRYAAHEDMIDKFVHPDRRGERGHFCHSMHGAVQKLDVSIVDELQEERRNIEYWLVNCYARRNGFGRCTNNSPCYTCQGNKDRLSEIKEELKAPREERRWDSIDDMVDQVCDGERYWKVNLQAYIDHGTLEFRHHNGSINPKTITNWIRFIVNFVEQSRSLTAKSKRRADLRKAQQKPARAKMRDNGPLMGLPGHVKNFFMVRSRRRTRDFAAWA